MHSSREKKRRCDYLFEWLRENPGFYTPGELFEAGFEYPEHLRIFEHRFNATRVALNELSDKKIVQRKMKTVTVGTPVTPIGGAGVNRVVMPTKKQRVYCWGVIAHATVQRVDTEDTGQG